MADLDDIEKIIAKVSPYYSDRAEKITKKMNDSFAMPTISSQSYELKYDSAQESLEPVYFWILDFARGHGGRLKNMEKITDTFTATPGSGQFGEMSQRVTYMQQQASKIMGDINTVIKSVLNLIYSLKEFQMRLSHYKLAESESKEEREAGLLALKQIWMDSVDVKRGNTSIKGLALSGNAPFAMLIDAFMAAKTIDDVDSIDLNERVKRILKPRVAEFFEWRERSYKELRKRYSIEKTYLKSQVASLRLYTRWARPYLKAIEELRMKETGRNPDLVNLFSTTRMQLTLMGKNTINFDDSVANKLLPDSFRGYQLKRKYHSVVVFDLTFRGMPQRIQTAQSANYSYGGLVEIKVSSYGLNDDELLLFNKKLDDTDLQQSLSLVEGMTEDSLKEIEEDVAEFTKEEELEEQEEEAAREAKAAEQDVNPFYALIFGEKKKKEKIKDKEDKKKAEEEAKVKKFEKEGIPLDNFVESQVRALAVDGAKKTAFLFYDVYKKAHQMPSHPNQFDYF
jgi:hypothetical protein